MALVFAAIAPHGFPIIPDLSGDAEGALATRAAMEAMGTRAAEAGVEALVIGGPHGVRVEGAICLADTAGVLRTLISATPEVRAERLSADGGVDLEKARKAIDSSDADRQDFLRRFYGVKHEEPWHYDLVINTSRLEAQQAADVIIAQAR